MQLCLRTEEESHICDLNANHLLTQTFEGEKRIGGGKGNSGRGKKPGNRKFKFKIQIRILHGLGDDTAHIIENPGLLHSTGGQHFQKIRAELRGMDGLGTGEGERQKAALSSKHLS